MKRPASGYYVVGGTLPRDAPSYVVRAGDQELLDALRQGEFCYALTARQMGKSSLMVRAAARLREEGVRIAILDLTAVGHNLDEERWYDGLLNRLGAELGLEEELDEFWLSHQRLSPLQRFMRALREVVLPALRMSNVECQMSNARASAPEHLNTQHLNTRVVIFIDEIDAVRNLPFSTDEFFAAIRECYNRRAHEPELGRLTFCLLGVATPSDLIQDTRTTPFNIGRRIELTDFTSSEAAILAAGLGKGREARRLLARILYWTGGHPYLTQCLCRAVAEAAGGARPSFLILRPSAVDRCCEELFLSPDARQRDDNLIFVRDRLLRSEADLAALLDLYRRVRRGQRVRPDDTNPLVEVLRLSGIVRTSHSPTRPLTHSPTLRVRNRIYARVFDREWVRQHTPGEEARRQRAAYRKGLVRAGVLASGVILAISVLAGAALDNAAKANRHRETADARATAMGRLAESLRVSLEREAEARRKLQSAVEAERTASRRADAHARRAEHEAAEALKARVAAERARMEATRRLWGSYLAQARAGRWSRRPGQRFASLDALAAAAAISPGLELRNEAIACLALPVDIRALSPWPIGPAAREAIAVDLARHRYAVGEPTGGFRIRRLTDHRELARLPAAGRALSEWHTGFSPDGRRFSALYEDAGGRVVVWDLSNRKVILHTDGIAAGFSSDGRRLACSRRDGALDLYELEVERTPRRLLKGSPPSGQWFEPDHVSFGPGDRCIAASGVASGNVRVYDLELGREVAMLPHPRKVKGLAWHPDGHQLASACGDGRVYLWDIPAGGRRLALPAHQTASTQVAFSRSGRLLASSGYDGMLRLWDPVTGQELASSPGATYSVLQFGPEDRTLGVGTTRSRYGLWEVISGREHRSFHAAGDAIGPRQVSISPDERLVMLATRSGAQVWETSSGRKVDVAAQEPPQMATFHPDEPRLISAGGSGVSSSSMDFEPTGPGLRLASPRRLYPHALAWLVGSSRDGSAVITSDEGCGLVLAGAAPNHPRRLPHPGVYFTALSPTGEYAATGTWHGRGVRIWNTRTGQMVRELPAPGKTFVAFSPDGLRLAAGGPNHTVLWNTRTWTAERRVPRENGGRPAYAAFSPDGRVLAVAHSNTLVKLLEVETGRELASLESPDPQLIAWLCFSPRGTYLAAACETQGVQLWDLRLVRRRLAALGLDW